MQGVSVAGTVWPFPVRRERGLGSGWMRVPESPGLLRLPTKVSGMTGVRELREEACRGCGVTFWSHLRSVVYCCQACSFLSPLLRRPDPHCYLCGSSIETLDPTSGEALTREQYWEVHPKFELTHRACLRAAVDRDEGEARRKCRCKSCQRERAALSPAENLPSRPSRKKRRRVASPTYLRNRLAVLERDSWICQICDLPLARDAAVIDDLYPQVDHIMPLAAGGNDEQDNLRAAHRWCNWALGDSQMDRDVRVAAHARFASRMPALVAKLRRSSLANSRLPG